MLSKVICISMSVAMGLAFAAELHVPAQYADVQDAISAASDGDVIILAQGTYTSRYVFAFYGKRITVRSSDPDDDAVRDSTVITNRVWFAHGEGPDSVLAGLTLLGGGISCSSSSPTIERNRIIFAGQLPDHFPQAHYFSNSKALIKGNIFASTFLPYYARLIYCSESAVRIVGNTFATNQAGWIIYVWSPIPGGTTIIQENCMVGNKASSAIYVTNTNDPFDSPTYSVIAGNVISQNDPEDFDSLPAIAVYDMHDAIVADNLVSDNKMTGIRCQYRGNYALIRNTISGNTGHGIDCSYGLSSSALVQHNVIMASSLNGLFSGGGMYPVALSNTIAGNRLTGLYHNDDDSLGGVFASNLIVGNGHSAGYNRGGTYLGGFYFRSEALFAGNTVVGNYSSNPGAGMNGVSLSLA